jgi:hypothetical protein
VKDVYRSTKTDTCGEQLKNWGINSIMWKTHTNGTFNLNTYKRGGNIYL